ncbi:MAG: ABC transporter substrate-binding protein [Deltaproteobacteria bacterium]|nr:ABC transporter substrate-binding protein [Deltaproteobacteria bacterium]
MFSQEKIFSVFLFWLVMVLPPLAFSQGKALKKIRVGVPSVSMGNIIIFVTKEAKLFEKYGLDAEVITMNGSGIASKALISGNIEISPIATPTVINANLAGSDMAILAHTMPGVIHALMVKPEIKRVEDLKGKKIAVSSLGSLTDFLVRYIARKKGLNPDRDLTLIQTGGDAERIVALKSGVVDGAAMSHPGYGRAQRLGFSMLWDSAKEVNYPWMEITTRKATARSDREMILSYMKAHLEGIAVFKKDREFGKKVIKKTLRLDDEELVNESYEIFSKAFLPAPYPNIKGMKTSFEYVAMTRPEVWNHKPEEFADASFVEELEKSGFIKKLY